MKSRSVSPPPFLPRLLRGVWQLFYTRGLALHSSLPTLGVPRVAVVGSGISGLAAAYALRDHAQVTLFEANTYFGGHTHTVDITLPGAQGLVTHGVDTGFLVFNERTYPQLIELFSNLGVATAKSDMSFSVQVPDAFAPGKSLEWSGSNLNSVFAQRGNLLRWRFLRLLREIARFNRITTALAARQLDAELQQSLGDFLDAEQFSSEFRNWYFLPMMGCIWSCPTQQMLAFPVATMIAFCYNHGLLQVTGRPQWWTVAGGAKHYVDKMLAAIPNQRLHTPVRRVKRAADGVRIVTDQGVEEFDHVVLATHSDQSLALLDTPTPAEQQVLGTIRYQPNRAVLHRDTSVLPSRKIAWAAWNYERAAPLNSEVNSGLSSPVQQPGGTSPPVCLHYLLNLLQPLPFAEPVVVSLNPVREPARHSVMGEFDYAHPVFDLAAIRAQRDLPALQGQQRTWFCGAWTGYGFHEDGLKSGLQVARQLLQSTGVAA